jgi:hypothetical protein
VDGGERPMWVSMHPSGAWGNFINQKEVADRAIVGQVVVGEAVVT